MHASEVRPVLRAFHQFGPHRILADILPLLRVTFPITQTMMKTACLKSSRVRMRFGEAVLPETHPTLDGEFQIARCAEQMQVIGHEQVIADEPCGCRVFPDVVLSALHGCLCQPALTFLRANSKKNPVRSAEGNVDPFGRGHSSRFAEGGFSHVEIRSGRRSDGKGFFCPALNARDGKKGQSGSFALPDVGRAALPRRPNFNRVIISGRN